MIISFRIFIALIVGVFWIIAVLLFVPEEQRLAWMLGVPALIFFATNLTVVFQGIEKLPTQSVINTLGVFLTAASYFGLFEPNMFLGADLVVISAVGLVTTVIAWFVYHRIFGCLPVRKISIENLSPILSEARLYWLISVINSVYPSVQCFLIAILLGVRELGIFRTALSLASGIELLFGSVSNLLLPRLVGWNQQSVIFMFQKQFKFVLIMSVICVPLIIAVILSAPIVYAVLLGPEYREGVLIFQIVIMGKMVQGVGGVYYYGLIANGNDALFFFINLTVGLFSLLVNFLFIPFYGVPGAAAALFCSDSLLVVLCYLCQRKKAFNRT